MYPLPLFRCRTARLGAIAAFAFLVCTPLFAHDGSARLPAPPTAPPANAQLVSVTGTLAALDIDNQIDNSSQRLFSLREEDGSVIALSGSGLDNLPIGAPVQVSGRLSGKMLFVTDARIIPASQLPSSTGQSKAASVANLKASGTLVLAHGDDFANAQSKFSLVVRGDDGQMTPLELAVIPDVLQPDSSVIASGSLSADGFSLAASRIVIVALPKAGARGDVGAKDLTTNKVLVILVKYNDASADPASPFAQADVQQVMTNNGNSVTAYYNEVSYGQHQISATVSPWLQTGLNPPASCDFTTIGRNADAAYAAAFPSDHTTYQNRFYVFPYRADCGWAGLAYIGFGQAWSNGYNLVAVYAHELGHNFGLMHAASLRCSGTPISAGASGCGSSEYGDPFDVMGNQASSSTAMHFNAAQKSLLNWFPAGAVATFGSGTATYTLSPIELAGGGTYAVKVPASSTRTYWIEYRQPVGLFDGAFSYPNNGAQIRVASPFESICSGCGDDTELLDMTPGTTSADFHDAALLTGQSFTDTNGITMSVLSASPSALTVQVSNGTTIAATTTTLASSANPSTLGSTVTLTATVTGTAPSGTVAFQDGGTSISGCAAVALAGSGNARNASCATAALSAGTHSIVANYSGDAGNAASASAALSQVVNSGGGGGGGFSNGGFESPSLGGGYQYMPSGATWVFTGNAGITGNANAFTSGNPAAPEGAQAAFLQRTGVASQTATVAAGQYTLSLQAAQRGNWQLGVQVVLVQVDGVTVGQYQPPGTGYTSYQTPAFTIAASGSHTITLSGAGSGDDFTAFVDNVTLTAAAGGGFVNGGFETPSFAGGYQYAPSGAAWVFSGPAGITGNANAFTSGNPSAPEGVQVAFVQDTGVASQTATIAAGQYTLSLQAAQRGNWQFGVQVVLVQVDGVTVGQYQPPGTGYTSYQTPVFTIAASGSHTITLAGVGNGSDFCAFVDNVTLTAAVGAGLVNAGFESPDLAGSSQYAPSGATWVFSGNAGITGNANAFTSGNPAAPEGVQVAFLQRNGSTSQTAVFAAGQYRLTLQAAQRGNWQLGVQVILIQVDGVTVGQYQPPGTNYTSYQTPPFTIPANGNHTVTLAGAGTGSDFTAFVDGVTIGP